VAGGAGTVFTTWAPPDVEPSALDGCEAAGAGALVEEALLDEALLDEALAVEGPAGAMLAAGCGVGRGLGVEEQAVPSSRTKQAVRRRGVITSHLHQ
jgi:hypothetical protein